MVSHHCARQQQERTLHWVPTRKFRTTPKRLPWRGYGRCMVKAKRQIC